MIRELISRLVGRARLRRDEPCPSPLALGRLSLRELSDLPLPRGVDLG